SLRIAQQRGDEVVGAEVAILGGPEGTQARLQPRPTFGDVGRFQDVGRLGLLPLPGHLGLELLQLRLAGGNLEDATLTESDVDSAARQQCLGLAAVERPSCDSQGKQRIVGGGLDPGRQHPGGGTPGPTRQWRGANDRYPSAEETERPSHRGPGGAATEYQNVSCEWHTVRNETFRCPAA